jgi:hypothetical protein
MLSFSVVPSPKVSFYVWDFVVGSYKIYFSLIVEEAISL